MKPVKLPRRVDEPPHLLLWSADEIVPMILGLTIGMMIGQALMLFLAGLLITNLYRRFRDNHPDGYLLHMLYRWGVPVTRASSFKNPFIRKYFP